MAVTELITFIVIGGLLAGFTYAGFLVGREAGERQAGETIANLRRAVMGLRARCDRLEERNKRLAGALSAVSPRDPDLPEWLSGGRP